MSKIIRIDIHHAAFAEGGQLAATIDWNKDGEPMEALEAAYRKTNSIDMPWWEEHADARLAGYTVAQGGSRSTSMGDFAVVHYQDGRTERWTCAMFGWVREE